MRPTLRTATEAARMVLPDGRTVQREVEIRTHPFTGETGRIMALPLRPFRRPNLEALYGHTRDACPFCPAAIDELTPRFSPDEFEVPRFSVGEARVFPNLLAYAGVCALSVISRDHLIPLAALENRILVDAFRAARTFFHAARDARPDVPIRLVHWNFMAPAGSSMVHPHHQLMATASSPNRLARLLEGGQRLEGEVGQHAWEAWLSAEEEAGERWIGRTGPWAWTCDPVPQGRFFELVAVHDAKHDLIQLVDEDYFTLVEGLDNAFTYLDSLGLWSFNLALWGHPDPTAGFRCQLRLVPRGFFPPAECADIHFDVVAQEAISLTAPETAAAEARAFFAGRPTAA